MRLCKDWKVVRDNFIAMLNGGQGGNAVVEYSERGTNFMYMFLMYQSSDIVMHEIFQETGEANLLTQSL